MLQLSSIIMRLCPMLQGVLSTLFGKVVRKAKLGRLLGGRQDSGHGLEPVRDC